MFNSSKSKRRGWIDLLTRWVVTIGGGSVFLAIATIFVFLVWVVAPIFFPASIEKGATLTVAERTTLYVGTNENGEIATRISADGIIEFYDRAQGRPTASFDLNFQISNIFRVYPTPNTYALLDEEGRLNFISADHEAIFVNGQRDVVSQAKFSFNASAIDVEASSVIDLHWFDQNLVVAFANADQVTLHRYSEVKRGTSLPAPEVAVIKTNIQGTWLSLGPRNEWLFVLDDEGGIEILDIANLQQPKRSYLGRVTQVGQGVTAVAALQGRHSLIVASEDRSLKQFSVLKADSGTSLNVLREFSLHQRVRKLIPEPSRKGFVAVDESGDIHLFFTTSQRNIAKLRANVATDAPMSVTPRSDALIIGANPESIVSYKIRNPHPEISFSSLWDKVWYEGYEEPTLSWQSSSADDDFEAKFSLVPLTLGTLKAAFYALMLAVPLGVMGAIYTAYFMAPAMRNWVKPSLETMAALPTVVLGFVGGLWLAPIVDNNLTSVLSAFIVLPVCVAAFGFAIASLSSRTTTRIDGWHALAIIPILFAAVAIADAASPFVENYLFSGDTKRWLRTNLGLDYDQRNAIVVAMMMGFAVVPTIFAIAEDAVYSVPAHLVRGSLALGATRWQTLTNVVILTASPGIFSAIIIGIGRAVGETMIVLMATGNTPLTDFNIFEGMRTFAANVAIELPESELDSSHYRILFLTALLLFVFTFLLNTVAEVIRQRLRSRFGNL